MRLLKFKMPNNFNLFLFGDKHHGNAAFSKKAYNKLIEMINSEYEGVPASRNYGIDTGDPCEFITRKDSRFAPEIHPIPPLTQIKQFCEEYQPIKHAVLFMLHSNHIQTLDEIGNATKYICEELGILYGTYSAKITFLDSNDELMFKAYGSHGRKSINSTADDPQRRRVNMQLILKRHLREKASDCALMFKGHTHKLLLQEPTPELCLKDDTKKIVSFYPDPTAYHKMFYIPKEMRWYVNTGSFLRLYALNKNTYSEQAEYDPVDLGFAIVEVRNKKISDVKLIEV